jgi:adenosylcobinamide-GDP ribazoletransferase
MKNALAAAKFLTLCSRLRRCQIDPEQVGKGACYFPVVGLLLGSPLVLLDRFLQPHLGSEILSVILVIMLALMTGAVHFDGLQNTFDGILAGSTFDRIGERGVRVVGLLAILFVVLLKVRALETTGESRGLGLLLAPLFARWALVIFLYGSAAIADRSVRGLIENVGAWCLVFATLLTLGIAVFLIGRPGLWIGLYISLFALLSRTILQRQKRMISHDNFGALIELSETLSFILFSTF